MDDKADGSARRKRMTRLTKVFGIALVALALGNAAALGGPLGLPLPGGLPGGSTVQGLPGTIGQTTDNLGNGIQSTLDTVKRDTVGRPLAARAIERDEFGARIVPGTILAVSPSDASLAIASKLDFAVVKREAMPGLGLSAAVLRAPSGMSAVEALAALRKADPAGLYDYDHLYDPSGDASAGIAIADGGAGESSSLRIGMIDGGISKRHRAFRESTIVVKNVVGPGEAPPTAHGTAIASLLVGHDGDFAGYLPGATLYAADVFGGQPSGGSADDIVRALEWLAQNKIAVVNVSLAGPPNKLLEASVKAFVARGHVLVAAVGNEGAAAPTSYPAGYGGVIGVTSVDAERHLQLDANRNAVTFAARGVEVHAAALERGYADYTGTSFAAPAVAARFALLLRQPDVQAASRARLALEQTVTPLGDPGFGKGYLAPPGNDKSLASGTN
jgi:hypothetical protein